MFANAKVHMMGPWILKYENTDTKAILHYAAKIIAHMIVGRMPVVFRMMGAGSQNQNTGSRGSGYAPPLYGNDRKSC